MNSERHYVRQWVSSWGTSTHGGTWPIHRGYLGRLMGSAICDWGYSKQEVENHCARPHQRAKKLSLLKQILAALNLNKYNVLLIGVAKYTKVCGPMLFLNFAGSHLFSSSICNHHGPPVVLIFFLPPSVIIMDPCSSLLFLIREWDPGNPLTLNSINKGMCPVLIKPIMSPGYNLHYEFLLIIY